MQMFSNAQRADGLCGLPAAIGAYYGAKDACCRLGWPPRLLPVSEDVVEAASINGPD